MRSQYPVRTSSYYFAACRSGRATNCLSDFALQSESIPDTRAARAPKRGQRQGGVGRRGGNLPFLQSRVNLINNAVSQEHILHHDHYHWLRRTYAAGGSGS